MNFKDYFPEATWCEACGRIHAEGEAIIFDQDLGKVYCVGCHASSKKAQAEDAPAEGTPPDQPPRE